MAYTEEQTGWLEKIGGLAGQVIDVDDDPIAGGEAELKRMVAKREKLGKILDKVGDLSPKLAKANAELTITWPEDQKKCFWDNQQNKMQWMTGDRDVEVDTVHDLRKGYDVDPVKAKEVQKLHMELVKLQTEMEQAVDENGKPLFTAKDIERELWSPLVRADIIPSNAVGDKYSQEAQVWNGACELYKKKLEDYSKKASKYDQVQRALRIGADTASLVGTLATESIKAANFEGMALSRKDTEKFNTSKTGIEDKLGGDKSKVASLSKDDLEKLADQKGIPRGDLEFYADYSKKSAMAKVANRDILMTTMAVGVVQGGLGIVEKALDKPAQQDGWKIAEAVYSAVAKSTTDALSAGFTAATVANPNLLKDNNFLTMQGQVNNLVNYGLKGGKVIFRVNEIANAKDAATAKAAAFSMVASLAGAVGNAFAAFDVAGKPEEGGTSGEWTRIGAYVESAILSTASIGKIADAVVTAKSQGKDVNIGAVIAACGLSVIGPIMTGAYKPLEDKSREDTGSGGEGVFAETPEEKKAREKKTNAAIQKLGGTPIDPSKVMSLFGTLGKTDEAKMRDNLQKALKKQQDEEAKDKQAKIDDFKNSLKDEETRKAFLASVQQEAEGSSKALEKLIEAASPDPDDLTDEKKAKAAMDAVEKLIAEAAALNAKWEMINALTAGGVGILVAALPVAGLAAAIQKLAMDVAILVRKSVELNKWIDNMALTIGNSSVYGPAIAGRLASAKVQFSLQVARVVFDSIGVAAESCKLADLTGISTGISIGNNMARALTEYGFKMQKEAQIEYGWHLYKKALANKGDRKIARKAMKWNSTLSKCVLAYGIVMDGDPIAKEVARSCGLTPDILADQKNVCGRVVVYFETLYSDDPVVMRRVPLKADWHPGTPILAFDSWIRFKAAASTRAVPPIAPASSNTPLIDRHFARLRDLIGMDSDYAGRRDAKFPEGDLVSIPTPHDDTTTVNVEARSQPDYGTWLKAVRTELTGLVSALGSYAPVTGPCPKDADPQWAEGLAHGAMLAIADSLVAQALLMRGEVDFDLAQHAVKVQSVTNMLYLQNPANQSVEESEIQEEDTE